MVMEPDTSRRCRKCEPQLLSPLVVFSRPFLTPLASLQTQPKLTCPVSRSPRAALLFWFLCVICCRDQDRPAG